MVGGFLSYKLIGSVINTNEEREIDTYPEPEEKDK